MIKFFRKIRQKLLKEGNVGQYLKYAVGEIVLVVIGILIALSINNWNESVKERKVEINYLKNIKSDLNKEIANNQWFIDFRLGKAKSAVFLLNLEEPRTIEETRIYIENYENVFYANSYVPNNNTFKELLSSGKLSLISNDSIKSGLQELEKLYASISIVEHHMRREFESYLYDVQINNTSGLVFFDKTQVQSGELKRISIDQIPKAKQAEMIEDAQWLYNSEVFNNGLKLAHMNCGFIALKHQKMELMINNLINLIDLELNKT